MLDFWKEFMISIQSLRTERDHRTLDMYQKRPLKQNMIWTAADDYAALLNQVTYKAVLTQASYVEIGNGWWPAVASRLAAATAISGTEDYLHVTTTSCQSCFGPVCRYHAAISVLLGGLGPLWSKGTESSWMMYHVLCLSLWSKHQGPEECYLWEVSILLLLLWPLGWISFCQKKFQLVNLQHILKCWRILPTSGRREAMWHLLK